MSRSLIFVSLIFVIGAALYLPTLEFPFYFDDYPNIVNNYSLHIKTLEGKSLWRAATSHPQPGEFGKPVHYFSLALNYYADGLKVRGYHGVNILLHLATGIAFFFFARMLYVGWLGERKPRAEMAALAAALLWLCHPVQTEAVNYIIQRKVILAALFTLAALIFYLKGRQRHWRWHLPAAVCFILGVGSRQTAILAPVLALALEYTAPPPCRPPRAKKAAAFLLLILALGALLYLPQLIHDLKKYPNLDYTPFIRVMTEWRVAVFFLSLLFWPALSRLSLNYDFPYSQSLMQPPATILALTLLGLLFCSAFYLRRRRPIVSLGIFWFLISISLEASFLPLEPVFIKRLYQPSLGAALIAGWVFLSAERRLPKLKHILIAPIFFGVLISLGALTAARQQVWRDPLSLNRDAAAKAPGRSASLNNLAAALIEAGQYEEGMTWARRALALTPEYINAANNLASALTHLNRNAEAEQEYLKILRRSPQHPDTLYNLGYLYLLLGRKADAEQAFRASLKARPEFPPALNNLGIILEDQDRFAEAKALYRQVLVLNPQHLETLLNLGIMAQREFNYPEAEAYFIRIININPQYAPAYFNLGLLYLQLGHREEGLNLLYSASRLDPGNTRISNTLREILGARRPGPPLQTP